MQAMIRMAGEVYRVSKAIIAGPFLSSTQTRASMSTDTVATKPLSISPPGLNRICCRRPAACPVMAMSTNDQPRVVIRISASSNEEPRVPIELLAASTGSTPWRKQIIPEARYTGARPTIRPIR
ncbi:hypothetical protein D3C84_730150 [compost metagenome]